MLTGGIVDATATTPVYPSVSVNQGTFRYSRDTSDQNVYDMDYYNLELSFTSGFNKLWALGDDRVVSGELEVNNTANLVITSDEARSVTVGASLRLTSGGVDNSDREVTLTLADGATVNRATGTLSNAPVFAGVVDVRYLSSVASVTTGPELPVAVGVLRDLQIWSTDQTVTLGTNAHVHGLLTLSNGDFDNDGAAGNLALTLAERGEHPSWFGEPDRGAGVRGYGERGLHQHADAGHHRSGTAHRDRSAGRSGRLRGPGRHPGRVGHGQRHLQHHGKRSGDGVVHRDPGSERDAGGGRRYDDRGEGDRDADGGAVGAARRSAASGWI